MRSRLIILWILLALLPLRGWSYSGMQVGLAAGEAAMAAQGEGSDTAHHASAPCHQQAAASETPDSGDSSRSGHAACSLCDLCHSIALFNAAPPVGTVQVAVTRHP